MHDRLRVMVVDDDPVTRHLLQDTCIATHSHIDCCALASAIDALLHLPVFKPHILFLDLRMPEVDGWEMVKQVKKNDDYAKMQIITLSALSDADLQTKGGAPKDSHFIRKPVDLAWLKGYLLGLLAPQAWV